MKKSILAIAAITLAAGAVLAQEGANPTGDPAHGKQLWEGVGCYECHGLAGQGAQSTGPRLARTQLPFAAFLTLLRRPIRQMPPYEAAVLSDQEAADIYTYLKQLPAPRDPKTVPLLERLRVLDAAHPAPMSPALIFERQWINIELL